MKYDLLIEGERIFLDGKFRPASLAINDGVFSDITVPPDTQISAQQKINTEASYVLPGFIDSHVHFNDPGRNDWEGFETGTRGAAAGGTTTIIDMPLNCSPTTTNLSALDAKKNALKNHAEIDYALWGGFRGNNLVSGNERDSMAKEVVGFKSFLSDSGLDEFQPLDESQLEDVLTWSADNDELVGFHAEWGPMIEELSENLRDGELNPRRAYLSSRPVESEKKAIDKVLNIVDTTDATVHFVHISSPDLVRHIASAQESGMDVTVETCPHYLCFDKEDFIEEGAILKCAPPLRSREDVENLWECVADKKIDFIASDHSPCPWEMREADSIWEAWGGIQNVQYVWLSLLDGASERGIDIENLIPLTSKNPASRFNLDKQKGSIKEGLDADLTIITDQESTSVKNEDIYFKHKYTPFEGMDFSFKVQTTLVRGNIIYDNSNNKKHSDKKFVQSERIGQLLKPKVNF